MLVLVVLLGLALTFGKSFLPSAFTFAEQQPLVTTQNDLTLKLDAHSFLSNVPITGYLNGTGSPQFCVEQHPNAQSIRKVLSGRHSVVFSLSDSDVATYEHGTNMAFHVGGNPDPNETAIGVNNFMVSNNCPHIGAFVDGIFYGVPFLLEVPQTLKETGGNFELKVFTRNDDTQERTLQILSSVYIEPQKCIDNSYVTYEQVFKQGSIVRVSPQNENEVGFRTESPTFCHSAPILKQYQDSNQVFEQSNMEYDLLNNGSSVTVPNGQQWVMFYRGLPAIDGALQCQDNGGVWNATDNRCELPPTLWFVCNGIVTQEQDCVVQTTDYRCQSPTAVLETQPNGSFICHEYFDVSETTYNCPSGSELKELPTGVKYCEYQPELVCNGGRIENGHCVTDAPPVEGNVPVSGQGAIPGISSALLIVIALVIGGLALWYFTKKKK